MTKNMKEICFLLVSTMPIISLVPHLTHKLALTETENPAKQMGHQSYEKTLRREANYGGIVSREDSYFSSFLSPGEFPGSDAIFWPTSVGLFQGKRFGVVIIL